MAKLVNICDVCTEIFAGGDAPKGRISPTRTAEYSIPIFSNGEDKAGLYGYTDSARVTEQSITMSARGTIGYAAIRTEPFVPIVRLITLVPNQNVVDIRYLYYAVQNYKFTGSGTSIPQLTVPMLKKYSFPLPDKETQQDIVKVLDKVNELIALRKEQLAKLDELVKARFVEMFGGIHDSLLYPYTTIGSFTTVMSGGTPDRRTSEYWQDGTIRWVKTTELQNCVITDTEEKITQLGMINSSAKMIPADSILIAMYGQGKTRGMTGYIAVACTTNQACACILPSESVNQKYLWEYMILSYEKMRDMAKGGNQPNLNAGIIKNFPVLMPPRVLQDQFATFVDQTNKSKLTIQASLDKLEVMKKALMQEYFG